MPVLTWRRLQTVQNVNNDTAGNARLACVLELSAECCCALPWKTLARCCVAGSVLMSILVGVWKSRLLSSPPRLPAPLCEGHWPMLWGWPGTDRAGGKGGGAWPAGCREGGTHRVWTELWTRWAFRLAESRFWLSLQVFHFVFITGN